MSRNMKAANEYIFSSFTDFVNKSDVSVPKKSEEEKPLYIKTEGDEKEWLKNLKIKKTQPIFQNFITAYINFQQQTRILLRNHRQKQKNYSWKSKEF